MKDKLANTGHTRKESILFAFSASGKQFISPLPHICQADVDIGRSICSHSFFPHIQNSRVEFSLKEKAVRRVMVSDEGLRARQVRFYSFDSKCFYPDIGCAYCVLRQRDR